ncbi:hypothetical protein P154DRAFT_524218 [Amniculicola lignicola CBS 123094]|uniref:Uncharacterized protein n=1 Tax=Amniculicola lignicola CBS 123094 TaxID=1392246 RepID=A0A6A5WAZ6_9PLEO|nr:hypothetical protein P154DRAFT_524218 [Amniculicola lignicola CBS 123094]
MGRGPKFSFPLPGRSKREKEKERNKLDNDNTLSTPSISLSQAPEWSPRPDSNHSYSKAERLLGTTGLSYRPSSRSQTSPLPSPGYMTITVSESSFGSDFTDRASTAAVEDNAYHSGTRLGMVGRPSSNILGSVYNEDGRRPSNGSTVSRQVHPKGSNSTLRSYYDAQTSPLAISQQTSASAVRDMALRKGKPPVVNGQSQDGFDSRHLSPNALYDTKKQPRKSKPARLDLSKLFPKPRANGDPGNMGALLSPSKLVNSPSAMSTTSEYFPRPMTREPTPTLDGPVKLTKTAKRQQASSSPQPQRSSSPVRKFKRDTYDSAKINVRRPPRGVQHWFDALGEDSDEDLDEDRPSVVVPKPVHPHGYRPPPRTSSLGKLLQDAATPPHQNLHPQYPGSRKESAGPNPFASHSLNSPSQYSMQSQASLSSSRTKESAFSKSNLQDSSVLSMSSSEDEGEPEKPTSRQFVVRDSIDDVDDEIIIGKAQAFEVRPRNHGRRPSEGKLSVLSTSTNAQTIEVMYSPEQTFSPSPAFASKYSSRRSSHVRQPSVIHEHEQPRPATSSARPKSPSATSVLSARTSKSEPRSADGHKLMEVTAEEEALLEMMRKKRAAMAKHSFVEGYKTAIKLEETRQRTPPEGVDPRTSAFLAAESPSGSPARIANVAPRHSAARPMSPFLLSPSTRGRTAKSGQDLDVGTSILRDSSSCESYRAPAPTSERRPSPSGLSRQLSPSAFSPLDMFPFPGAPTPTEASIASPTTTDHASPLPSPVTPGLRHGEADVNVKVATSEPSCDGIDDVAVAETGVIEPPSGSIMKSGEQRNSQMVIHQRRRTASSGADVSFSPPILESPTLPRKTKSALLLNSLYAVAPNDPAPDPRTALPPPNTVLPTIPPKSSRRSVNLSVNTLGGARSRQSSFGSSRTSRTSSPALAGPGDRRSRVSSSVSRGNSINSVKRESSAVGTSSTRCSVSEDVLAAWGNLGGWRDIGGERY